MMKVVRVRCLLAKWGFWIGEFIHFDDNRTINGIWQNHFLCFLSPPPPPLPAPGPPASGPPPPSPPIKFPNPPAAPCCSCRIMLCRPFIPPEIRTMIQSGKFLSWLDWPICCKTRGSIIRAICWLSWAICEGFTFFIMSPSDGQKMH